MTTTAGARGHRLAPHTADIVIEAWGGSVDACLEEAATALVTSCADVRGAGWARTAEVELTGSDEQVLVDLLEEIIYRLDTDHGIPVRIRVRRRGRAVQVAMWLTDRHRVEVTGPAPKGVAYSQLSLAEEAPGHWRCRVTVDV
ncbi:MAG: archease [Nitriliruptoraceae bacterium]